MHKLALVAALFFASTVLASCHPAAVESPESAPPTTDSTSVPREADTGKGSPATTPAATSPQNDALETAPDVDAEGSQLNAIDQPIELPGRDCDGDGADDIPIDADGDGVEDFCEINHQDADFPLDTDNLADTAQDPSPQQIGPPMDCDLDGEDDDIRMDYDGDGLPDECEIY